LGSALDTLTASNDLQVRLNRYAEFDRINGAYLDWQLEQFLPFLGDRILEIGCGIGGILERLPPCSLIYSLDVEADVLAAAQQRFAGRPDCQFSLLDLATCSEQAFVDLKSQQFDTVLAINVLEHIQNDGIILQRVEQLLRPGGHLLILVPAHQWLYGEYDRLDGHFRRYSKNGLARLISQTKLRIRRLHYFNLLGAAGWWLHYRFLKNAMHGAGQFALMSRMIPLMKWAERIVSPPFGLSVIAVLQNPAENDNTTGV